MKMKAVQNIINRNNGLDVNNRINSYDCCEKIKQKNA